MFLRVFGKTCVEDVCFNVSRMFCQNMCQNKCWSNWIMISTFLLSGTYQGEDGRYYCSSCGRNYKQKGHLTHHIKFECNKDPQFQCPFCSYRGKQKSHLKRHLAFHHQSDLVVSWKKKFVGNISLLRRFICFGNAYCLLSEMNLKKIHSD